MSLINLSCIGHCGNFIIEDSRKKNDKKTSTTNKVSLYDDLFGGGTGDLFSGMGLLAGNKEISTIEQSFNTLFPESHNVKMVTFGLDSIFGAAQASPFSGLESVGFLKYIDLSNMASGLKLPTPLKLLPTKGRGR